MESIRLNKYISASGICSRREADRHIEQGNVIINGRKAKIGDRASSRDRVTVNGRFIEPAKSENIIFIAFNKPVGITSTTEADTDGNIVEYVNHPARIFPIGRLDKDSQGLIFLTNNGDIVNKILRAGNEHEKEYIVTVNKPITKEFIAAMASGVSILGVMTKKCVITKEAPFVFRIILIQGMNRQIRRMCEHFDYGVTKLERVRIMNVSLKGLPIGDWRDLTEQELTGIYKLIENSTSTKERSHTKKNKKKKNGNYDGQSAQQNENKSFGYSKSKSFHNSSRSGGRRKKSKGPGGRFSKNKFSGRGKRR